MKLNRFNLSFSSFVLILLSLFVGSAIMTSCKGKKHSVREMREGRSSYVPRVKGEAMVQRLFLENKRPSLSVPRNFNSEMAGGTIAVEQTVYKNPDNHSDLFQEEIVDNNKTYGLSEVVVEARSRFTPERDGRVDVDFIVKIPKQLVDRNWMVRVNPFIVEADSARYLDPVVIKGEEFALKQKADYKAFDDYASTIIPREYYNKIFLHHELIEKDIQERQNFYYNKYHKDWAIHKEYEQWLNAEKQKDIVQKTKLRGEIAEMRHAYLREMQKNAVYSLAQGIDTTGMAASYEIEFLKKSQKLRKQLDEMESKELDVPSRYKSIHEANIRSRDIKALTMSSKDTLDIAKNRYMFDAIMENEMKKSSINEVKEQMIPFPYVENARIDSVVQENQDFVYYYRQQVPVTPGMSSVKISMESQVIAMDDSRYTMEYPDTLSYFISSIVQLVDTTLLHKETVKNRNAVHKQTAYLSYRPNTWRFDPKYNNNKAELEKIGKDYDIFRDNKSYEVDSILMQMSTSLDGDYNKNADLSMKRVDDLKRYMIKNSPMSNKGKDFFVTKYIGEDWSGLARLLRPRTDIKNKDAILDILANAVYPDKAEEEIKAFAEDYQIIKDSIYPKLDRVDMYFYVHRTDMTSDQEIISVDPEYIRGVRLLQNREYDKALEILANYPDYNAAVCLVALGYNGKAYEVLSKLKPNSNTEYLSAIVAWRMKQNEPAVRHLLKAVEMDQTKLYRMELDPDIMDLIRSNNLNLEK